MGVEPVPGEPAAIADIEEPALVVADYHAGLEQSLRRDGVELRDRADARREHLLDLVEQTEATRVVVLGDLVTSIGEPAGDEHAELDALFDALSVPVTVVKGNHDGEIESALSTFEDVTVTPAQGDRLAQVGFAHGHTWPAPAVVEASTVCVAHEHPMVRLEDEVGGARTERVWLRGRLNPDPFEAHLGRDLAVDGELVMFPAFNGLTGGTWVNAHEQEFLAPFLPEALIDGEAYLLDGTRLGDYRRV